MIKFSDIEDGYKFVNAAPYGEHRAFLSEKTGKVIWDSAFADDIKEEDLKAEIMKDGDYIEIPHKYDIGAGKKLLMLFAIENLPQDEYNELKNNFAQKGGYNFFLELIKTHRLSSKWQEFSQSTAEQGLKDWLNRKKITYIMDDGEIVTPKEILF